ncbi:MAG: hypothetical protein GY847_03285 [Proteobacteria bacterium]|nr:hypothetical protein [Pseudomonadota bacterium]
MRDAKPIVPIRITCQAGSTPEAHEAPNGKAHPLRGCGQEPLPQNPPKARGAVEKNADSAVGWSEG